MCAVVLQKTANQALFGRARASWFVALASRVGGITQRQARI
jgi:hypothetical protein